MVVADFGKNELMSPVARVASISIFHLVFGQIERTFVTKLLAVRFAHQHDFVEQENVTSPLARILILVGLDAKHAITLDK